MGGRKFARKNPLAQDQGCQFFALFGAVPGDDATLFVDPAEFQHLLLRHGAHHAGYRVAGVFGFDVCAMRREPVVAQPRAGRRRPWPDCTRLSGHRIRKVEPETRPCNYIRMKHDLRSIMR